VYGFGGSVQMLKRPSKKIANCSRALLQSYPGFILVVACLVARNRERPRHIGMLPSSRWQLTFTNTQLWRAFMYRLQLLTTMLMCLPCVACSSTPARPTTAASQTSDEFSPERAFVERFHSLGNTFDPKVVDLYADDAVFASARTLPDGTIRPLELRGPQVKQLMSQVLPLAKASGDTNRYSDVRFEKTKEGVRVRATRYSERKCTTDSTYSLTLRATGESFVVVREESATHALSACPDQDPRPMVARVVAGVQPHLPLDLDADTRLDAAVADNTTIAYRLTLTTMLPEDVAVDEIEAKLRTLWTVQACLRPDLRPLLDNGASLRYEVRWKDGRPFTSLTLSEMDCS